MTRQLRLTVSTLLACTLASAAHAAGPATPPEGLHFQHHDWVVACDNTRTCRVAGYQPEPDELSISLLLTREAGPNQPVQARLTLGDYGSEAESASAPSLAQRKFNLRVNGKAMGALPWLAQHRSFGLTAAQLQAVLKALPRAEALIEFTHGPNVWRLSDQGAAAVLLKMDEAQGRIGTPGALVRRGSRPESQALPALPMPVVKAAPVPELPKGRAAEQALGLSPQAMAALRQELTDNAGDNQDPDLQDGPDNPLTFAPLGHGKWLVSRLCWRAAYNEGYCMWVMNERPPHQLQLVTESASDHTQGVIMSSQKGRGLGDCWGNEEWTWDGRAFVHTAARTTGLCRLVTPGGAWDLPTRVTRVIRP